MVGAFATYKPSFNFIGVADNEAENAMQAQVARAAYGVTGAGVTVGVLSDSVNQFNGGIAASVATGDIPSASRVTVLQDGAAGESDEGRAMIENIFDIAPGVNTAFATADGGQLALASNIQALATQAHAQVITDDIAYPDEPWFQFGPIEQAVTSVVASGVTYTSAAGNSGDAGYMGPFRGVTDNPNGSGSGLFMNFNTGAGAAQTLVTMTVAQPSVFSLQWDNPFFTTSGVTSNVVLDLFQNGQEVLGPTGNNNAVALQQPLQLFDLPVGTYQLAIQVTTTATPTEIRFQQVANGAIAFGFTASNTGAGVSFPTSFGHNATPTAVGTGATPFWWGTGRTWRRTRAARPTSTRTTAAPGRISSTSAPTVCGWRPRRRSSSRSSRGPTAGIRRSSRPRRTTPSIRRSSPSRSPPASR